MTLDGREFRNALGRFTTGVCVITTIGREMRPIGMTINSFAAVSLEPPLVLWSLQKNSEVYNEYADAVEYIINVLSSDQQEISRFYSRKGEHFLQPEHSRECAHGGPVIHDALVTFNCEHYTSHSAGDHLIIVGRVKDMIYKNTGNPLLFYSGGYRGLC